MKKLLNRLYQYQTLSIEEAQKIVLEIGHGDYDSLQIASFLTVFNMRSVTVEELRGFKNAMLELCTKIDLDGYNGIDNV